MVRPLRFDQGALLVLDQRRLPAQEKWLRRFGFFEHAGDRWWPIAGGVYFLRATKRVLGMRIITPAWDRTKRGLAAAPRQARECIERTEAGTETPLRIAA